MERLFFAVIGGGLIVYGFSQRDKWITTDQEDPVLSIVDKTRKHYLQVQDEAAKSEGNVAIVIGLICLGGAFL